MSEVNHTLQCEFRYGHLDICRCELRECITNLERQLKEAKASAKSWEEDALLRAQNTESLKQQLQEANERIEHFRKAFESSTAKANLLLQERDTELAQLRQAEYNARHQWENARLENEQLRLENKNNKDVLDSLLACDKDNDTLRAEVKHKGDDE